ncbi:GDP-L-galactose phosphorylase 1-like isoform X2 [Wolffia australiana]
MLTIKRVPTVVSNFQETSETAGCGRNCLVSTLPLYTFTNAGKEQENVKGKCPSVPDEDSPIDFLNTLVLGQWEDRQSKGLFRYDVTACESKVIEGEQGFIAQLNEGRHLKKRPTEFRVDQVLQPFDPKKFNFTKIGQEEVLFRFEESSNGTSRYFDGALVGASTKSNVVTINVSPIEYGHVLLIPRVLDCFPQKIDAESFFLAVKMAEEGGSPYFRLGYNSLGAFATINHLHFQAYYLSLPFPVEKAPTRRLTCAKGGVHVSTLMNYPVRGLVFEGGSDLRSLSDFVSNACIFLQENNIPFNVLISDSGKRIFLFPQCYAEKQALGEVSQELLDTQVNPAVWEISGHMVLKRRKDYVDASEDYAWKLLAEVSLSEARFKEVQTEIFEATGLVEEESNEEEKLPEMAMASSSSFKPTPPSCVVWQ